MRSSYGSVTITAEKRKPFKTQFFKIIEVLNVVPLVFLKLAGDNAVLFVEQDLRLERFCHLKENFTSEECSLIGHDNFTYVKNTALVHEENFNLQANLISTPISLVVVAFAASWSDRHGRIPLLKLSIVGYFLAAVIYILFESIEEWPVEVLLVACILRSFAGGPSLFSMAVFSMRVDKSHVGNRALQLGLLTNMIIIGQATGYYSGMIVKGWGNTPFWVIFFALLLYVMSMLFTHYLLKEDREEFESRVPSIHQRPCLDLLHPENIPDLFRVAFRKRQKKDRLHILLILLVTFFVLYSPPHLMSEWVTTFLVWEDMAYAILSAVSVIGCQILTIIVLRTTQKYPIQDCLLAAIAEGMTAVQDMLLIAVTRPELSAILYLAAVFSLSHNLANVGIRSALSKLCEAGEIGRVFGLMALQETIMFWGHDLMYQSLWDATRDILPTSQHILAAFFAVFNAFVLFCVFFSMRINDNNSEGNDTLHAVDNDNNATHESEETSARDNHKTITKSEESPNSYYNFGFEVDTKLGNYVIDK